MRLTAKVSANCEIPGFLVGLGASPLPVVREQGNEKVEFSLIAGEVKTLAWGLKYTAVF